MPEITEIPPLTEGEASLVDNHSMVNTLSVLRGELEVLGLLTTGDVTLFKASIAVCDRLLASLTDRNASLIEAARIDRYERSILNEVALKLRMASRPLQTRESE